MQKISVLLANHSRLIRELLSTLFSDQPDVAIVGAVSADEHLATHVGRTKPDFIIIDLEHATAVSDRLLHEFQHLKVIAVPATKDGSRMYWTDGEIHWRKLATSVEGILHALREGREGPHRRAAMGLPKAS
jgi:chemotaxis response regulator CheB